MSVAHFPFFQNLPTVLVALHTTKPRLELTRRLLIDSGFTGKSALVLNKEDAERARRRLAPSSQVSGALLGAHERVWVQCSVPALSFTAPVMAISSDLSSLSLPDGIDGLAGLAFLSLFSRWGAHRQLSNEWSFTLELLD